MIVLTDRKIHHDIYFDVTTELVKKENKQFKLEYSQLKQYR